MYLYIYQRVDVYSVKIHIFKREIDSVLIAYISLAFNGLYSLYNLALGIFTPSWTFIALFGYYAVLGALRFGVLMSSRKSGEKSNHQSFLMKFSGGMFIFLSITLAGLTYLAHTTDTGKKYHEIVMITMALYTTVKVTLAIMNFAKSRKREMLFMTTLRGISLADALVSVFALQRSMLMTFDGMSPEEIGGFNLITGGAVASLIFILGVFLLIYGKIFEKTKVSG